MQPKDHRGADQFFFDYRATNDSDGSLATNNFSFAGRCINSAKDDSNDSASSSESGSESDDFDHQQQARMRKRPKFMNARMLQQDEHREVMHEDLFERMRDCDLCKLGLSKPLMNQATFLHDFRQLLVYW